jgi:hypothetical protein
MLFLNLTNAPAQHPSRPGDQRLAEHSDDKLDFVEKAMPEMTAAR